MKGLRRFLRFNGGEIALTNYTTSEDLTYSQLTMGIVYVHRLISESGIKRGDKILISNDGTAGWAIKLVGAVTYGLVAIGIPCDLDEDSIDLLKKRTDVKLDFNDIDIKGVKEIMLNGMPVEFNVCDYALNDLIMRNYTHTKNGELQFEEVKVSDIFRAARVIRNMYESLRHSRIPSLFLANCDCIDAVDVLASLSIGAHLTLAGIKPSSATVLKCVKKCRPHFVYLDINTAERLIRERIYPMLHNPDTQVYMRSAHTRRTMLKQIRKRMMFALGGCLMTVWVTGSTELSPDIESFLQKIDFPYQFV